MMKWIARCLWCALERAVWHRWNWGNELLSFSAFVLVLSMGQVPEHVEWDNHLSVNYSDIGLQYEDVACLTQAIIHEAGGEPTIGQVAVAHVVKNRVANLRYKDSICGVVHEGEDLGLNRCQFSYYCDGKADVPLEKAREYHKQWQIALDVLTGTRWSDDPTEGALFYYAAILDEPPERRPEVFKNYTPPTWKDHKELTARIGGHKFYRDLDLTKLAQN